jgi:hypothetical protein
VFLFANLISVQVFAQADFRSLCLTSRTLRELATPRLYHTVAVALWDQTATNKFVRSVAQGAGLHLQYTRTLVFEDAQPAKDADSVSVGALALPASRTLSKVDSADKDRIIQILLQMIPENKLRSFR